MTAPFDEPLPGLGSDPDAGRDVVVPLPAPAAPPDGHDDPSGGAEARVVALNDAAAVFEALADGIRGAAVGWSPLALELLQAGLRERYGHLLGDGPIERLVDLAGRPSAA